MSWIICSSLLRVSFNWRCLGRLLGPLLQPLQRRSVLGQVDPLVLLEFGHDPLDDPRVDVVATQVRIPVGRLHLDDVVAHLEDRDIERAPPEIEDRDQLVFLLVEAVRERRCRRLVDDPQDLQPRDRTRVLGRLPLGVVEVRRHRDDRFLHRLAQIRLRGFFQLPQHHGGDLLRGVLLPSRRHRGFLVGILDHLVGDQLHLLGYLLVPAAHEPLDREDGVLGVQNRLPLGHLANEDLAPLAEADHRRRKPASLLVDDDLGLPAFHHGHRRVRGAEVDPDDFRHLPFLLSPL
jgi:hypothetical protein